MAVIDTGSLMNETSTANVGASRGYAPAGGGMTKAGGHEGDAGYGVDTAGGPGGGSIPTVGQGGGRGAANDDFGGGGSSGGAGGGMPADNVQSLLNNPDGAKLWHDEANNGMSPFGKSIGIEGGIFGVFKSSAPKQQMMGADGKPIGPAR